MNDFFKKVLKRTKVVTQSEVEKSEYLVCGPYSHYEDDIHGECSLCGNSIVWRPHGPKSPKKICLNCFLIEAKGEVPEKCSITLETLKELK